LGNAKFERKFGDEEEDTTKRTGKTIITKYNTTNPNNKRTALN